MCLYQPLGGEAHWVHYSDSNHAGNTNDTAITPWDALPVIAAAAGDKLTIIADSGVRRGSDVMKALALGADIVAIGRATLYGVCAAG